MAASPSTVAYTADLFGDVSPAAVRSEFDRAFLAWQQSAEDAARSRRPLDQPLSQAAYLDLWNVFARWCAAGQCPPLPLAEITAADLRTFLQQREEILLAKPSQRADAGAERSLVQPSRSSRQRSPRAGLTNRYVWRVLHVIDRVLMHHADAQGLPPNPAARELLASRPEWQHANARHRDTLPDHLPPGEASVLVNFLSSWRQGRRDKPDYGPGRRWQDLRNLAAIALHLGAGLTPAEVRAIEVQHVVIEGGRQHGIPWKVRVPALGETPTRETPLSVWAGKVLAAWLDARAGLGEACGSMLFPATRTGRPWSKLGHYKAITETLDRSGISKEYVPGGAFRLRHTFAIRQLRRRESPERVSKWLGVQDPDVVARYLAVVDNSEVPV